MSWKKKERELSQEEAIELARKELEPYWLGSKPLLAAVKPGQGAEVQAFPLDPIFVKNRWLIALLDPTTFSGETTLFYLREFFRRYADHDLSFLLLCRSVYSYLREKKPIENMMRSYRFTFPAAIDHDGAMSRALGAKGFPRILLSTGGQFVVEREGLDWMSDFESEIQKFLRSTDPGLPLLPIFQPSEVLQKDTHRLEFGKGRGAPIPEPGFKMTSKKIMAGVFKGTRPQKMPEGGLFMSGQWIQDEDYILTADPTAQLGFRSPGAYLSVVAQALSKNQDAGKVAFEINHSLVSEQMVGPDMGFDVDGLSVVEVKAPRLYHALVRLPVESREVTLRFPTANRTPVALYGIRFGQ
jgi:hypothetical protein